MTTTEPGAATAPRTGDPAGLGRGPLTRLLPVWWQAEAAPPTPIPYPVDGTTRASRFLLRVLFSAPALTVPAAARSAGSSSRASPHWPAGSRSPES